MTELEMMQKMQEIKEENQEKYMEKLLEDIKNLAEKANKKDYKMTLKEQLMFSEIVTIVNWIEKNC